MPDTDAPSVERTTTLVHPGLPDLDAALSWVVQTVEREGFTRPEVKIRPITWVETYEPDQQVYEVSVSQHRSEATP